MIPSSSLSQSSHLYAGVNVTGALLSHLQSPSTFPLLYLCGHVLQFPGKTGALRLQPKFLLLFPLSHAAPKQVFMLPGQTLHLCPMEEERRRQASPKPWKNDCKASSEHYPLCPPVSGLALADPQAQSRSGSRSCLQPAPHNHIPCWCTMQEKETLKVTWFYPM